MELATETVVGLFNESDGAAGNPFVGPSTAPAPWDDPPAPARAAQATDVDLPLATARGDGDPSRLELLQRAAARGPQRTWESIILSPADPILGVKMLPHVAQRRARFRRAVKVGLGLCAALFLAATAASAFSTPERESHARTGVAKTAPATAVVPVEKLEVVVHGRAPRHTTATATAPRWKRR